jgi:hypothetical protein
LQWNGDALVRNQRRSPFLIRHDRLFYFWRIYIAISDRRITSLIAEDARAPAHLMAHLHGDRSCTVFLFPFYAFVMKYLLAS